MWWLALLLSSLEEPASHTPNNAAKTEGQTKAGLVA
jgi:hypothetical protein